MLSISNLLVPITHLVVRDAVQPLRVLKTWRPRLGDLALVRRVDTSRPQFGAIEYLTGDPIYTYVVRTLGHSTERMYHVLTADEIHPVAVGGA